MVIDKFSANVELLENFSKEYGRWSLSGNASLPRTGAKSATVNADSLNRPGDFLRLAASFEMLHAALLKRFVDNFRARTGNHPIYPCYHMAQAIFGLRAAYDRARRAKERAHTRKDDDIALTGGRWVKGVCGVRRWVA